jgi:hypothetical protein
MLRTRRRGLETGRGYGLRHRQGAKAAGNSDSPFLRLPRQSSTLPQGDGVINTAYIERLNATFRERLASLTRRGRTLARHTLTLRHGMYLIGTLYNCCPPPASLRDAKPAVGVAGVARTPAMAAGITNHCWTVQELLSFHVPSSRWTPLMERGRPSHALKRLVERWCS